MKPHPRVFICCCLMVSAILAASPARSENESAAKPKPPEKSGKASSEPNKSLSAVLEKLKRSMAPVTGIDADFRQLKKLSIFSKTLVITGKMEIRTPRFFKWEILAPLKSSIVVNGDSVTTWDEETNAKVRLSLKDNPIAGGVWTQMDAFFMGRFDQLKKLYKMELVSQSPVSLRFEPLGKPLSTVMKNVTLTFAERGGLAYLAKVEMVEKEGDSTTINFTNVKLQTKSANPK